MPSQYVPLSNNKCIGQCPSWILIEISVSSWPLAVVIRLKLPGSGDDPFDPDIDRYSRGDEPCLCCFPWPGGDEGNDLLAAVAAGC